MLVVRIDIEFRGPVDQLHRATIDIEVIQFDIRVHTGDAGDYLPPETRAFQDVGLVHRSHLAPTQAGKLEGAMGHAFHLVLAVDFCVDSHPLAVLGEDAARVAEIDPAQQLAHNDQVRAPHQIRLQCRQIHQRIQHLGRAQVHIELLPLPQLEQPLFRTKFRTLVVPLRPADRSQQDGLSVVADGNRFGRKRYRGCV